MVFANGQFAQAISPDTSPYIDRVYDYIPAPGQFINTLPKYEEGDTYEQMVQKAENALAHNKRSMVCLGGFGGSITFGFDHDIPNIAGQADFQILGNAMLSGSTSDGRTGGSSEPGIIYVATDENGNGLPDDRWYEIAGSEYSKPATVHNYTITFYRTPQDHQPTPSLTNKVLIDTTYIRWQDTDGVTGYIEKNSYHTQDYFPQWIDADSLSFTGTRLADNAEWVSANSMYVLYCYDYGYADNYPNNSEQSKINIDWAVDENGQPANLSAIRFVKVVTGINQSCGWIGETSTEVMGAVDLHYVDAVDNVPETAEIENIITLCGQSLKITTLDNLPPGIYLLTKKNGKTVKIKK